jgi:hypothetical protein
MENSCRTRWFFAEQAALLQMGIPGFLTAISTIRRIAGSSQVSGYAGTDVSCMEPMK